jgi:hypothetical protein
VTGPRPLPRSRQLPPENTSAWAPRVARDARLPSAAPGTPADARARPPASRRARPAAEPVRASGRADAGTPRRTPAASPSRNALARTSSGTRCIDGTSADRAAATGAPNAAPWWLNIAPPPALRSRGALAQYRADRWLRLRAPLKRPRAPSTARHRPLPGGCVMLRPERPSVSRVREIRTHGLKGGPALSLMNFIT